MLGLSFALLAVVFAIWNGATVYQYVRFARLRAGAQLTWLPPRPWFYNLCIGIGFFMLSMTAISAFLLHRSFLSNFSQALMALFYTVVFPLSFRIRRGFYEKGVWSERRFVPFSDVRWVGWKDENDVVLVLRTEPRLFSQAYAYLKVPGDYYGEARRILAERIKDKQLSIETGMLGLADGDVSAQERV